MMDRTKLLNHLKEWLTDLKHRPALGDLLPLLIILVVVKFVVFVFQQIVHFSGGGLNAPYKVLGESLSGFGLSGSVGQREIVNAISVQPIGFDTSIFLTWFEYLPLLEWIFIIGFFCAWLTPGLYFAINLVQKGGLSAQRRKAAIGVTSISGVIAVIGLLAGGYSLVRPDQFAATFGGAIIYGGFLQHLFTDPKTKQRKWWPRVYGVFVFVCLVTINLVSTGTFFSKIDPDIEKLNRIISDAYLSGWVEEVHLLLVSDTSLAGLSAIALLAPLIIYEFIKDKIVKLSPVAHMVLVVLYWTLIGCIAAVMLGMIVFIPATMTFGLLSMIWLGMSISENLRTTYGQKNKAKEYLDRLEDWANARFC